MKFYHRRTISLSEVLWEGGPFHLRFIDLIHKGRISISLDGIQPYHLNQRGCQLGAKIRVRIYVQYILMIEILQDLRTGFLKSNIKRRRYRSNHSSIRNCIGVENI